MQNLLQEIVVGNLFAFLIVFMRFGTALMVMPGIGDSFVSPQIRLLFALALSFVVTPALTHYLPSMPANNFAMVLLVVSEAFVGFFIGGIMRILVSALDTAGMVVSMQSGFANAMIFNPVTATQGSVVGSVYSVLGVTLLLVSNMHHYMIASVVESYQLFPAHGQFPSTGDVFEIILRTVAAAFKIGIQMALPFLIVGTLMQYGFGLLNRLMPQIQIFFISMPLQIAVALILIAVTLSVSMHYWLVQYGDILRQFTGL